jgi:hypothetical protein
MARRVKSKAKNKLIIFFDAKLIVHKEFALTGQTVNSSHYCDVLRRLRENVRTFRPEGTKERAVSSRQRKHKSVALVRKRTILTERPPLVGEISAKFCWLEGCHVVSAADPLRQ